MTSYLLLASPAVSACVDCLNRWQGESHQKIKWQGQWTLKLALSGFNPHVYFGRASMLIDHCLGSSNQTLIELGESKLLGEKMILLVGLYTFV